jgi:hypothetical protein
MTTIAPPQTKEDRALAAALASLGINQISLMFLINARIMKPEVAILQLEQSIDFMRRDGRPEYAAAADLMNNVLDRIKTKKLV